ncbi:chemotaxis protein CheX [Psychrobacter pygoscelis]|uniref:chemotaxis protein CheX n=1 Tax=Psychrobacter pygoscelis TaxID=2488563 RepID=UPI00103E121D|nr:chemotaxis protein CheX [Psychrobacter pygoscelis]
MVKAEKLGVFVNSVAAFFSQIGETLTDIDTPYLHDNASPIGYDYSGVIKITGPLQGSVYVSAPSTMLRSLLTVMNEPDSSLAIMKDLLGEIANTVSGNARTEFGSDFVISPPQVVDGVPSHAFLPKERRSYIIPFHWHGSNAVIGICIA